MKSVFLILLLLYLIFFGLFFIIRPAGVVRGIGMTQDVRGEKTKNPMRVADGSFFKLWSA